jgi:hypothetical protein
VIDRDPVLPAWPFFAAAIVCGFLAWQLYDDDSAERALTRATAAMVLIGIGVYSMILPTLGPLFPSVALAGVLRESGCTHPVAASAGYGEPSLVFLAGTEARFTDASGAADFLREGDCRFAFIETHQESALKRIRKALLVSAQKRLGCAMNADRASKHSTSARGASQAWHRCRPDQRGQIYGAAEGSSLAGMEDVPS